MASFRVLFAVLILGVTLIIVRRAAPYALVGLLAVLFLISVVERFRRARSGRTHR